MLLEILLEKYQEISDKFDAIDGHDYESNINKKLNLANLSKHKDKIRGIHQTAAQSGEPVQKAGKQVAAG